MVEASSSADPSAAHGRRTAAKTCTGITDGGTSGATDQRGTGDVTGGRHVCPCGGQVELGTVDVRAMVSSTGGHIAIATPSLMAARVGVCMQNTIN